MPKPKRSYGLLIDESHKHGMHTISATVIVREDDRDYPCNPDFSCEDSQYGGAPKHLDGVFLNSFGITGHVSDIKGCPFLIGSPAYHDLYSIDCAKAEKMIAVFKRVGRQFDKDRPGDPGDVFMTLARALRLDFAVWKIEGYSGEGFPGSYQSQRWYFTALANGRDHFRRLIVAGREAMAKTKGEIIAA